MPSKFKPTREHKRKVLARRNDTPGTNVSTDTNLDVVVPASKDEREQRREILRAEIRAQQAKPSAKKQKRLDKYIDKKLKKEESLDLLKKLAAEKNKHNTTGLQSSKHLNVKKRNFSDFVDGQLRPQTQQRHIAVNKIAEPSKAQNITTSRHNEDTESLDSFEEDHPEAFAPPEETTADDVWLKSRAAPQQGTGLAQPLQVDASGLPIIPTRPDKRQKSSLQTGSQGSVVVDQLEEEEVEMSWEGFSDSGTYDESCEEKTEGQQAEIDPRLQNIDSSVLDALLQELEHSDESEEDSEEENDEEDNLDELDTSSTHSDIDEEYYSQNSEASSAASSTSETSIEDPRIKPRVSAFKSWATQQLNASLGHVPSYEQPQVEESDKKYSGVKPAAGYKVGIKHIEVPVLSRRGYSVHVERPPSIMESRSKLPILQREQEIMEAVYNNPVVVVKGETGSGKTTQLPQFLFEAGFGDKNSPTPGMIGVTQPRRVAAVSMAKRVGEELGSQANKVAHQIRFDTTVSDKTAIKFMTDGILLRELSQDLLLKKYSVIVIDEAHERSVNTDILIGMLSKIVPARMRKTEQNPEPKPLKLIIMSATLNIRDFLHEKLFPPNMRPPVVEAEGRQHRVTTHFALRSRSDYTEETIEKVKRAHRKLPRGGILVFLTGQNEIRHAFSRLRKDLEQSSRHVDNATRMTIAGTNEPLEMDDIEFGSPMMKSDLLGSAEDDIEILVDEEEADAEFEISDEEEADAQVSTGQISQKNKPYDTVHLLPLYSQLPTKEQLRIFEPVPDRSRLIVLATNVAETSLTIPGIKYVFDCGRSKERKYDADTNVQSFEIDYISKASAQQRAGRAGRTGPGHCWRLYSSAMYEQYFPDHTQPEILRTPAENVVLQLKGFRYPRPVREFPFPSSPSPEILMRAEKLLGHIGAVADGGLTGLGKKLSAYPLSPRLGKILVKAVEQQRTLPEALAIVAALSVDDIFVNQTVTETVEDDEQVDQKKQAYGRAQASFSRYDKTSDILKTLTAVQSYISSPDGETFCQQNFVRPKALAEISQLYTQLRAMVKANNPHLILKDRQSQAKLNSSLCKEINTTVASGFIDQVALRYDLHPTPPVLQRQPTRAIDVPYLPLIPLTSNSSDLVDRAVFIHPSSLLSRIGAKSLPSYIVYRHLQKSQTHAVSGIKAKTRMFPLTSLDASSLLSLIRDTGLIKYGKPVPKTKIEDVPSTSPKERICWVSTEVKGDGAGSFGWQLPPSKVRQVMDLKSSSGWRVVEVIA